MRACARAGTRVAAAGALAVVLAACASAPPEEGAAGDLRALLRFLGDAHPRPHTYVDAASLAALVEVEAQRLAQLGPGDEAWLELGRSVHRVLGRLGDGHLAVALPGFQPDAGPLSLLPVVPKRAGATTFIDASAPELPHGTALLEIDGEAIDELWAGLSALVLSDGDRAEVRRAALERDFARHYHLEHGLRARYRVRVRLPDGTEQTLELAGIDRAEMGALARRRHSAPIWGPAPADPAGPPWPWLLRLDEHTALLRLPSFGIPDPSGYRARIDEIFAELGDEHTLVLDLRGNQGGLRTHGIAVLNHLLGRPYAQWTRMAARVRRIPRAHRAQVGFPFVPEAALGSRFSAAPDGAGRFVYEGDPLAAEMIPHGPGYQGRIVVFVDGATNSAAVEMVAALLAFGQATLIGEETGGECGRHVGETPVTYTTPSLGVVVLASLIELTHVSAPGCAPGRGFRPDRPIRYDEQEFLARRDPYLVALARLDDE